MPSSNKRSGIPIPSFQGAVDVSPSVDSVSPPDAKRPRREGDVVVAKWKEAAMMQLEVSLQHYSRRNNSNSNNWKKQQQSDGMKLEEFYALVRGLDWNQVKENEKEDSSSSNQQTNDGDAHKRLTKDLTREERLLHDLACVAANPNARASERLYRLDVKEGRLVARPHAPQQLRQLLKDTTSFDKSWSKRVVEVIYSQRKKKKDEKAMEKKSKEAAAADAAAATSKEPKANITRGMTIDERVHARAAAKQQYQQQLLATNSANDSVDSDRAWTLKLADSLWNHANSILQRQTRNVPGKLASNSILHGQAAAAKANKHRGQRKCVLTFQDVIKVVAKSQLGEATPGRISNALIELSKFTPRWIFIVGRDKKSFKWSRNATTIFITPDNYQAVRCQLTGTAMPSNKQLLGKQLLSKQSSSVQSSSVQSSSKNTSSKNPSTTKVVTTGNPLRKPATPIVIGGSLADNNSRKRGSPAVAKKLFDDDEDRTTKRTKTASVLATPPPPLDKKKRIRDDEAAVTSTPSKSSASAGSPKRKKRLRINPHLILSDADYNGGEVLPMSVLDAASPRGLKRLFLQLNAGKRI